MTIAQEKNTSVKAPKVSRVAKKPIQVPEGVTVTIDGQHISVKGAKGELSRSIHSDVSLTMDTNANTVICLPSQDVDSENNASMQAGTARALCSNMIIGVSKGFEKKLKMIGVGYRANLQGQKLVLAVGKSHPDEFLLPEGIAADLPSQTEITIKGIDKQVVGQVAAKIRAFRPPEPYKGKGIRYADEYVIRKEAKK
jgi:large subunit ribosomal protein L6